MPVAGDRSPVTIHMPRLGVNVDHIATLRQVRKEFYPDPLDALPILQKCKADQITCHLREDRRHMQDHDLERLIAAKIFPINLEMALTQEMIFLAARLKPQMITLVPEKRQELTTEGGLDLNHHFKNMGSGIKQLHDAGIKVSLFINADDKAIDLACELGVDAVEFHTGVYCEHFGTDKQADELDRLKQATLYAKKGGLHVYAGHGLNWLNLKPVVQIKEIEEYNIGHSIIARAVFLGLEGAVKEIQEILKCVS